MTKPLRCKLGLHCWTGIHPSAVDSMRKEGLNPKFVRLWDAKLADEYWCMNCRVKKDKFWGDRYYG